MRTTKGQARLRLAREVLGRTGEQEGSESGFTLIELMVVLLIMAILLAIAIPTFLSVTSGAKKTATQSDLENALTSVSSVYANAQSFPIKPTPTPTATASTGTLVTQLQGTQSTIKFWSATASTATKKATIARLKGLNAVQVWTNGSGTVVFLSAIDGANGCWVVGINETTNKFQTLSQGIKFFGHQILTATAATIKLCSLVYYTTAAHKIATATWKTSFQTVSKAKPTVK